LNRVEMSYLGLDIGTGGCKAAVFGRSGEEQAYAFREYSLIHPEPGLAELDPEEVITKCFEVIAEVNSRTVEPVTAMGISSQGEAFAPVEKDGSILGNAMVSSDSRAKEISSRWSATFGNKELYRITGHTPHPLFTLFKILWIRENRPDLWKKASLFLCFEDLFHYKVGLEPGISWPLAGRTMLFDVKAHRWSHEILSAAGLPEHKLAKPMPSGEVVGVMDEAFSSKLGFKAPVTVVAGGHDQTCAALGAGVTGAGHCMYATGSVECFCPVLDEPRLSEKLRKHNLCCYDYTIRGKYTTVAYSLTGGNILRWWRDGFYRPVKGNGWSDGQQAYSELLDEMTEVPSDLLVLPYFSATGTPYFDVDASGAIIGLRMTTGRGEITRALLEGVAMEMKLNLKLMEGSGMHITTLIATGGGTRNRKWTQLKADVLNKKIIVCSTAESGCLGAAMLARSAMEKIPVELLSWHSLSGTEVFTPDPVKVAVYSRKFGQYEKLYHILKEISP
jgi:xylulokinase